MSTIEPESQIDVSMEQGLFRIQVSFFRFNVCNLQYFWLFFYSTYNKIKKSKINALYSLRKTKYRADNFKMVRKVRVAEVLRGARKREEVCFKAGK